MTHSEAHHPEPHDLAPSDPAYWDERYATAEQLWSGMPNQALVLAAATRRPGRALDVGCGEGADAIWLAQNGWQVTGLDVSAVALERAAGHAREAGVSVAWVQAALTAASLPRDSFDLVSAQYPVLQKSPRRIAEHILIDLVAPGGTLVFVHHADFQSNDPDHHGFNPADYLGPWDLVSLLDEGWLIEANETRPRLLTAGAGAGHTEDVVLIARRVVGEP